MTNLPLRAMLLLTLLALNLSAPGMARGQTVDPFAAALDERMPGLLARYQVSGAVVSYIRDGAVAWTRAYGVADRASGAPMQPDMLFNHGSNGKVLTAWGILRLVEQGRLELDAPANRYLKRWQVQSTQFDPSGVTLRRLLSHTAGLTVHGFTDYSPRRALPSLAEMLDGRNQLDGRVVIASAPGARFDYSGGGYVLLQMIIEDVTGEPFAAFMQREVTGPLGLGSLHWAWTPEMEARAPVPYGLQGEPLEYRQLGSQAIGSEVSSVPDFARFVAAAVAGPGGEPPGRGVLQPATLAQMLVVQPNTNGTEGLGYGIGASGSEPLLMHFGSNTGWNAHFVLDTQRREGLVIANNAMGGNELNLAVHFLWLNTALGEAARPDPAPAARASLYSTLAMGLAALLGLGLAVAISWLIWDVRGGRRRFVRAGAARHLWPALSWAALWALAALAWWYAFYAPLPLPLPPAFPDLWRLPQTDLVMAALLAWTVFSLAGASWPLCAPEPLEDLTGPSTRGSQARGRKGVAGVQDRPRAR